MKSNTKDNKQLEAGQKFEVTFPFHLGTYSAYDEEGTYQEETWIPGCKIVHDASQVDYDYFADAEGKMILTVVDIHKPGKYPERVFYTRKWISPEGKEFGSSALRVATTAAFRRRATSYLHKYKMAKRKDDTSQLSIFDKRIYFAKDTANTFDGGTATVKTTGEILCKQQTVKTN